MNTHQKKGDEKALTCFSDLAVYPRSAFEVRAKKLKLTSARRFTRKNKKNEVIHN